MTRTYTQILADVQARIDEAWGSDDCECEIELPADCEPDDIGPNMVTFHPRRLDVRVCLIETYPHPTKANVNVALFGDLSVQRARGISRD